MKLAYLFPGQGAQYVGMGVELAGSSPAARDVFKRADAALGFSLTELCFVGPGDALGQTVNTQPAILATSLAVLAAMEEAGMPVVPDMAAGLSLGEYSALVAAGAISLEEALLLVRQRGRLMEEAVPEGQGAMAAVLGLSREKVLEVCLAMAKDKVLAAVNFNCPGQIVVAGHREAVEGAGEAFRAAGAKRVVSLVVSGPFHTVLMESAAQRLKVELAQIPWRELTFPIVSNVTASPLTGAGAIVDALTRQVSNPVLWEDSLRRMWADGVRTFIEVGPGKTLSALVRKTIPEARVFNIDNGESLAKVLESYREVC